MTIKRRIVDLEKVKGAAAIWEPVMIDRYDFTTHEAFDAECLRIENEARASGWEPGAGVCMIVVDYTSEVNYE